jgi:hypothetical protein
VTLGDVAHSAVKAFRISPNRKLKIMYKVITVVFFIFVSYNVNAQSPEMMLGKWVFKEALNKDVDALGKQMLEKEIINKMTFEFKSDGDFIWFAHGETTTGRWVLYKKTIVLTIEKEQMVLTILELSENRFALKMGLGEFLLKRI